MDESLRIPSFAGHEWLEFLRSRRSIENQHAHLFATVKANKQLGSKCNVFAEFHDLAGYVTGPWQQLGDLYQNRALSIGATLYPFRK